MPNTPESIIAAQEEMIANLWTALAVLAVKAGGCVHISAPDMADSIGHRVRLDVNDADGSLQVSAMAPQGHDTPFEGHLLVSSLVH